MASAVVHTVTKSVMMTTPESSVVVASVVADVRKVVGVTGAFSVVEVVSSLGGLYPIGVYSGAGVELEAGAS